MLQFKQISMRIGLVAALILVLLAMMVVSASPVNARPHGIGSDQPLLATDEDDEELDLDDDEDEDEEEDEDSGQDDEDEHRSG
jgi:hypothetical protein